MRQLLDLWDGALRDRGVHPIIALAAFDLDFPCIDLFRDGHARVSRLPLLLQCYHQGLDVGRYINIVRLIEENKERDDETLEQSPSSGTTANRTVAST